MPAFDIASSPVARLLLELEERAASGGLDVGGRRLVLSKGAIVEVRPAADDQSLGEFLVLAGRLTTEELAVAKKQMTEARTSLENVLRQRELLPIDVLLETRRALWLDRFVRGVAVDEAAGRQPGLLTPEPHASPGPAISTLPFVLDGLARRAGFGDAERVGRSASAWFDWIPSPLKKRASEWADFGEVPDMLPASALFARHPAAPSRIAALVRAGLARLSESRPSIPPPAPRNPGIAAPAPIAPRNENSGSIAPPSEMLITMLEPGRVRGAERPIGIDPVKSWFPSFAGPLQDPLDPLERRIAGLEQAGADAAERAQAWLDLARALRNEHDSIEEAQRAAREAVAAEPQNVAALELAAELCSASGQPELAYAYSQAAADAQDDAPLRAQILTRTADYATRAGKASHALRALRLAHAATSEEASCGERYARKLAERGDPTFAVKAARQAAERYRPVRPEAARAVLSWAIELAPEHAELASDYASCLAADGYGEAAIAVLVRAARRSTDTQTVRRLLTNAALRAELVARPDLAADVLIEAVDRDGSDLAVIRAPLLSNLTATGNAVELAVIATEMADRAEGLERATWLRAAGDARLELPGSPTDAIELFVQAFVAEPRSLEVRETLQQFAESASDSSIINDAIERALRTEGRERNTLIELCQRLITRGQQELASPALERWAWALLAEVQGPAPTAEQHRALEARVSQYEAEVRALEQDVREASPEQRIAAGLRLAARMREDPARRGRARKLLEKILELEPGHLEARSILQAILRIEGDLRALCAFESQRVTSARTSFERVSAELSWIRAERELGNLQGATEACLALLSHAPKNREGLLWLLRLAQANRNPSLLRDARARRVESALDPRERARALTALAASCLAAQDETDALGRAEAALMADPRAAEAAMILVELASRMEPAQAVANLRGARGVLGDTPDLLTKLSRASFGARDGAGQLEALEAFARLSPFDPIPALGLVALRSTGNDATALLAAIENAAAPERYNDATPETLLTGLERLFQLDHATDAIEAVIKASDRLGERADLLIEWALPLAREQPDHRLLRALIERSIVRATGDLKRGELRRLLRFHREYQSLHGEARTCLRLLALDAEDPEALERLAHIYASTRETERLLAVLTLRLDLADTLDDRRSRLLELALACLDIANDLAGAEDLLSAALSSEIEGDEKQDPPVDILRRGIGLVLGSEHPQLAFDLLLELSGGATPERSAHMLEEAIIVAEIHLHNPDLALRAAKIGLETHPLYTSFLLHFERLALELGDVATGREVYRHLAESAMGAHGRRAVLYRGARWLERAGAMQDALSMAEEAFVLEPTEGAVFSCLERLARVIGQHTTTVRALRLLAEDAPQAKQRGQLLLRAATLCEDELRDPEQALALYMSSFRVAPEPDVELRAMACARRLADADPDAARLAHERWRDMLLEQAKDAWAIKPRVRALLSIARMELAVFQSEATASARADEARKVIDEDKEVLGEQERSELLSEVSEMLARIPSRFDAALSTARAASAAWPQNNTAKALEQQLSSQRPADPARPAVQVVMAAEALALVRAARGASDPPYEPALRGARATARMQYLSGDPRTARKRSNTDPGLAPVVAMHPPLAEQAPPTGARVETNRTHAGVADRTSVSLPETNQDSVEQLLAEGGNDPTWAAGLCESALARARAGELSLGALRTLLLLAERSGRRGLAEVMAEALSYISRAEPANGATRVLDPNDSLVRLALLEARDDGGLSPAFTIMAHVFQGAGPLFRKPLSAFNVSPSDFVAPREDGGYGTALRDLFQLLSVQHEAYIRPGSDNLVSLAAAQTPAIIIGAGTPKNPLSLRFRLARTIEQARPGSVLLSTMPAATAETLLSAVKAAFGPTDAKAAPVAREAASIAAELWRTMPSGTQRQVSNLLRVLPETPSYALLMASLEQRAVRVGLIAAGSLDVALAELHADGAVSRPEVPRDQPNFDRACRENRDLAALLRFAVSEPYLALREAGLR